MQSGLALWRIAALNVSAAEPAAGSPIPHGSFSEPGSGGFTPSISWSCFRSVTGSKCSNNRAEKENENADYL